MSLLLALQILVACLGQADFPDCVSELLKSNAPTDGIHTLVGSGGEMSIRTTQNGKSSSHSYTVSFDYLSANIWRVSTVMEKNGIPTGAGTVRAFDAGFAFKALRESGEKSPYSYGELGFDSGTHSDIKDSVRRKYPLLFGVRTFRDGTSLGSLLSLKGIKAIAVSDAEAVLGYSVVGVEFEIPTKVKARKQSLDATIIGRVTWIPEAGFSIRSSRIAMKLATGKEVLMENRKIDYRLADGALLPCRQVRDFEDGRVQTMEITEFRNANPDRKHYTAESIGLSTPRRPIPKWKIWGILAVICFASAVFVRRKYRANH